MSRFFVALGLPAAAIAELVALQPSPTSGLRLAGYGQMHLTLHYIGDADAERTATALGRVAVSAFPLALRGVGQFLSTEGAVTLWAGVHGSAELLGLHAAIAGELAGEGFRPESRPYTPHVTLARCEPGVPEGVVAEFLARHEGFSMSGVSVAGFGLYSSTFAAGAPVYRRERSFRLLATEGGDPA